jgi:hypothetical protein
MNSQDTQSYTNHDEIWLLLPWHANGSLEAGERERVQAHLRVCLLCRREMAAQATLAKRLRHAPRVDISAKPSFDRLLARIQSGQAAPPKPAAKNPWPAAWAEWLLAGRAPPRLAAACASLLLIAAIPLLPVQRQEPAPGFHTVADSGSLDRFARNDLRVIFAEQATGQEIGRLVSAIQGRIVDGPSPIGLYTVRLAAGGDGGEPGLARVLARLRGSPSVLFAEPALARPSPAGGGGG